MTYTGPADSVVPGNIIGSTWIATVSVQQVFWCGYIFTCSKGTLEPSSSAVLAGLSVNVDGANYTVFATGVPGIGYILGLKDFNGSTYIPLQNGVTQSYPAEGTSGMAFDLGWSAKLTYIKTDSALKTGVYAIPTINAAILTAYNNETKTAQVIIDPTTVTVTARSAQTAPVSNWVPLMYVRYPTWATPRRQAHLTSASPATNRWRSMR